MSTNTYNKLTSAIATSVKHKLGHTAHIILDSLSDDIRIKVEDAQLVSITNDGKVVTGENIFFDRALDVSKVTKVELVGLVISLMLDNIRLLKTVDSEDMNKLNCKHVAARFILDIIPVIEGTKKLDTIGGGVQIAEAFNYEKYGLDATMFASGNKSTYQLPKNGGIKLYLKPEFKREFDNLVDAGLLSEEYGRNLVKEGEFSGYFAVVVPLESEKAAQVTGGAA